MISYATIFLILNPDSKYDDVDLPLPLCLLVFIILKINSIYNDMHY